MSPGSNRHAVAYLMDRDATGGAVLVFVGTFVFRWLTIDFDNDYFMHLAWAAEMVRGEWPVRDFVEPGFPLQTLLAFIGLFLCGHQLVWESVIACAVIAAGDALIYLVCRRIGIPPWLALTAAAIAAATFPRMYAYPKAFVYPAALYALAYYLRHPSRQRLALVAGATAVAFLFRHDHGLWLAIPCVTVFVLVHRTEPMVMARAVFGYGLITALLVAPWIGWVGASGHADQYLDFLVERGRGLTNRWRVPDRQFSIDSSRPLLTLAPIAYPTVGIRWAPNASDATRRRAESRYGLEPIATDTSDYKLTNVSSDNVRALVSDPAVEDTRGIDRGSLRAPAGILPWIYLQGQQYVPPLRLRALPGIVRQQNAEPWLTWVTFTLPWLVLASELIRAVAKRGATPLERTWTPLIVAAAVLSIITYQTLVRASPDSRLGDVAAVTAVLVAWIVHRAWSLSGWTARAVQGVALLLLALTVGSAVSYGRVVARLAAAGVDGPVNLVRRAGGQSTLYGGRPLDLFAPPGAVGLARLSRWLNDCTRETDRVSVIGFEPQVFFLAERGFAGGLAFYDLGWNSSERDQQLAIERWSRQRVPVILAMETEWESFSRDYSKLRAWIDTRYEPRQRSAFGGGKPVTVLVDESYPSVRTHAATGLPCFR